jgi:RNA methyltransferase, TrmH family
MSGPITSPANPKVKALALLRERKERDAQQRFLVEGMRAVDRLVSAGRAINELFVDTAQLDDEATALVRRIAANGVPVTELGHQAMAKVSYRDNPEAMIAVAPTWTCNLADISMSAVPLILVVEAIEKPGNLGAILRTADATGCDCVVVCEPIVDLFNPNVIRSATAVVFSMPVIGATPTEVRAWIREHQLHTVATTPDTDQLVWDTDLARPTVVLMGAEDTGLSEDWLRDADARVRLPMAGQADSLNVAVATAVVLYEAVRQRSAVSSTSQV